MLQLVCLTESGEKESCATYCTLESEPGLGGHACLDERFDRRRQASRGASCFWSIDVSLYGHSP